MAFCWEKTVADEVELKNQWYATWALFVVTKRSSLGQHAVEH